MKFPNKGYNLYAIRRPAELYNTNLISVDIWMFPDDFYPSISLTNVPNILSSDCCEQVDLLELNTNEKIWIRVKHNAELVYAISKNTLKKQRLNQNLYIDFL